MTLETYPVADGRCGHCGRTIGSWPAYLIVAAFQAWARKHGEPPTSRDWAGSGTPEHPAHTTVYDVFGTWGAAMIAAGFEPRERSGPPFQWTQELIVDRMTDWVFKHGRWPTMRDWAPAPPECPSLATILSHFGSWNAARRAAGYSGSPYRHHRAGPRPTKPPPPAPSTLRGCVGCGVELETYTSGCRSCMYRRHKRERHARTGSWK